VRLRHGRQHLAAGAERDEHDALGVLLAGQAQAERRRRGVRSADRHGDPGRQAERSWRRPRAAPRLRLGFGMSGGSSPASIPSFSQMSAAQVRALEVEQSVAEASETSLATSPVRRARKASLGWTIQRVRAKTSGSCAATHMILGAVKLTFDRLPVRATSSCSRDPLLDFGRLGLGPAVRPHQGRIEPARRRRRGRRRCASGR
jgi:hypothetical protein